MKKATFGFNINDIAEIAILCSLAIVLDQFCKIPLGATGGSINLSMLPLYIIALRHGWFKGFIGGGIIYAVTTCIIDGYGFQFFPLEYFVAYGSVGILGIFANFIYKKFNKNNKYKMMFLWMQQANFLTIIKKTDRADSLQIKLSDSNLIMKIIAKR